MNKRIKRAKKIATNPKTVRFETLNNLLIRSGFERRQPRLGSSHYVYSRGNTQITIPYKKPFIKEISVKRVLELIGETK